jgi:hypothetical protein
VHRSMCVCSSVLFLYYHHTTTTLTNHHTSLNKEHTPPRLDTCATAYLATALVGGCARISATRHNPFLCVFDSCGGRCWLPHIPGTHPQSVFLCQGCRLGGFVPLSRFFHGFVGYFYQSSRTNVDSFVP